MEIDHHHIQLQPQQQIEDEEEDPFLRFISYAKAVLSDSYSGENDGESTGPGWSWIASRILKTCVAYSSGVTPAILLSELSLSWSEAYRYGGPKKQPECITQLKKKPNKRPKLPNTVTIDSILEKKSLSLSSVIEAVVVNAYLLPGNICMLTLGDFWSSNTIDHYLHRRFYNLSGPNNGILKKGREIFLTGCYLRTGFRGSNHSRLLPTENLVILLDEDQDDDAMLLGAHFCADSFSSISLDAFNRGVSYSFYGRIESIGMLEKILVERGSLQRKQITLVDQDGVKLKILLWGHEVLLASLLSLGSMLALDKPHMETSVLSAIEPCEENCLQYGSSTQLYLVPSLQHEEHVRLELTQTRYQGSKSSELDPSQGPKVSQVTLPCDSQGSIDFSNYPFRSFVTDLHDKMTSISLYGVVTDINKERNTAETTFSVKIEDPTGAIWAKLCFVGSWSLGKVDVGHTVYISGLTCSMTKQKRLEVLWSENEVGASFVNLSSLPALLNSSCLHKLSHLSDLSIQASSTHICNIWLEVEHCHVNTRLSHALCGHFVDEISSGVFTCSFCHDLADEIVRTFHLKITLADESAKVIAWCTGQTAVEMLQISPDEFYELPEEDQMMYPSSLAQERFTVAIVNCKKQGQQTDTLLWEITRALKRK